MNVTRLPLCLLEDLPSILLVYLLTFLVSAKPGLTNSFDVKWADVGDFALLSCKAHAIARSDILWQPIRECGAWLPTQGCGLSGR